MMDENLQKMFRTSSFSISAEPYFYCQVKTYPTNPTQHFMVSHDSEEITVITQNLDLVENMIEKNDNAWLLVSLNLSIPFMKGTLYNVSKVIYEANANILIVSTYSKDLLFIKEQDKVAVIKALEGIGFRYEN